ncbi:hypothetical protein L7F22_032844 [Adiantum nelumboides]|nr:hypothetical protein [Adiantum nelumboides]
MQRERRGHRALQRSRTHQVCESISSQLVLSKRNEVEDGWLHWRLLGRQRQFCLRLLVFCCRVQEPWNYCLWGRGLSKIQAPFLDLCHLLLYGLGMGCLRVCLARARLYGFLWFADNSSVMGVSGSGYCHHCGRMVSVCGTRGPMVLVIVMYYWVWGSL